MDRMFVCSGFIFAVYAAGFGRRSEVDNVDAMMILQYAVGLIESFPVEQ